MFDLIAKPFGILMMWLYQLTNNYMLAIILFSLIVKLILLPFQMKSKKSMMKRQLLMPQQQELQKKHGANQQAYQQELMKLYQEEGVNPMGGCLWALLPFPILIALYAAIRKPLTVMMGVAAEELAEGGTLFARITELVANFNFKDGYAEIRAAKLIHENWSTFSALGVEKLRDMNYNAFGLDLGAQPQLNFWAAEGGALQGFFLLLIPILAALLTWLPTKISKRLNEETLKAAGLEPNPDAPDTTKGVMMFMPLMTLWFCFIMPAALGVYWIANSVFGVLQDVLLTRHYNKTVAAESADRIAARRAREEELERKRAESERRRAEEGTTEHAATSKKKQQNKKKQQQADKALEWQRAHNPEETVYEPSRVGNRRYARGRAYDPDRFSYNGVEGAVESTSALDEALTEEQEELLERAVAVSGETENAAMEPVDEPETAGEAEDTNE